MTYFPPFWLADLQFKQPQIGLNPVVGYLSSGNIRKGTVTLFTYEKKEKLKSRWIDGNPLRYASYVFLVSDVVAQTFYFPTFYFSIKNSGRRWAGRGDQSFG